MKFSVYFLFEINRKHNNPTIEKAPVNTIRDNNEALIATSLDIPLLTNIAINPPSQTPIPAGTMESEEIKTEPCTIAVTNIKSKSTCMDFKR